MRAQQHELLQEVHAQREELAAHKRMLEMYAQVRRVVRTTIPVRVAEARAVHGLETRLYATDRPQLLRTQ